MVPDSTDPFRKGDGGADLFKLLKKQVRIDIGFPIQCCADVLTAQADEFHSKAPERSLEEIASSSSAMAPVVAVRVGHVLAFIFIQATASKQANVAIQAQSEKVRQKRLMKELRDIMKSAAVAVGGARVVCCVEYVVC